MTRLAERLSDTGPCSCNGRTRRRRMAQSGNGFILGQVSAALATVPKRGDWKWPVGVAWHCITIQAAPPHRQRTNGTAEFRQLLRTHDNINACLSGGWILRPGADTGARASRYKPCAASKSQTDRYELFHRYAFPPSATSIYDLLRFLRLIIALRPELSRNGRLWNATILLGSIRCAQKRNQDIGEQLGRGELWRMSGRQRHYLGARHQRLHAPLAG